MLATLPEPTAWNQAIGPFYRTAQVARLLNASRQAVDDRRRRGTLLACRTTDGVWAFPSFQFAGAQVRSEVLQLLRLLDPSAVDGWTLAAWLRTPQAWLEDLDPVTWVGRHGVDQRIASLITDQSARWAA